MTIPGAWKRTATKYSRIAAIRSHFEQRAKSTMPDFPKMQAEWSNKLENSKQASKKPPTQFREFNLSKPVSSSNKIAFSVKNSLRVYLENQNSHQSSDLIPYWRANQSWFVLMPISSIHCLIFHCSWLLCHFYTERERILKSIPIEAIQKLPEPMIEQRYSHQQEAPSVEINFLSQQVGWKIMPRVTRFRQARRTRFVQRPILWQAF